MKRYLVMAVVLLMSLATGSTARAARREAPAPTVVVEQTGCVTAECHVDIKKFKVLHGPVNVNACDACHKLTDAAGHKFEYVRKQADTCTFCHQLDDLKAMPVVHEPVAKGECLSCHNPHGGTSTKILRGKSMRELCIKCHKVDFMSKKAIHGPVAAGACDSCHQAHASNNPKLVVAQGRELCFTCHAEMKTQLTKVKFVHKAVEQDCSACHDAHASDFPKQVKAAPVEMCTSCHEKVKQDALGASHKHSVVTTDAACMNCHTPHGGDLRKLMKAEPVTVCIKCHEKKIDDKHGHVVASVASVVDSKLVQHGPIKDGNCAGCHNVHGSDVFKLLNKPYPETFYTGFSMEKYDLCFNCHDKQLVVDEKAKGLTGFRNGDRNLHFVHVNKADKGRTCRACHATHSSQYEVLIRDSVPYGKWEMPINFKKTETGGSCSPGCHKAYDYDRDKPTETAPKAAAVAAPTKPAISDAPAGAGPAIAKENKS